MVGNASDASKKQCTVQVARALAFPPTYSILGEKWMSMLRHFILTVTVARLERWQPLVLLRLERKRFGRWRQFFRFAILGGSGQKIEHAALRFGDIIFGDY
jgi:hypothetical protein